MKKVVLISLSLAVILAISYGCATRKGSAFNENETIFPSVKPDHAKHDRGNMDDASMLPYSRDEITASAD